jgi:Recombinase
MARMAQKGNVASATVRRATVANRNEDLLPVIEDIRGAGLTTPQQIADGLNERGITAARGGSWSGVQVRRILQSTSKLKQGAQRVLNQNKETIAA